MFVSAAFLSSPGICLLHSVKPVSFIPLSLSLPFFLSLSPSMAAWDLAVTVEDLGTDAPPVNLSVTSELHVGGVILKLVEKTRRSLSVWRRVSQSFSQSLK